MKEEGHEFVTELVIELGRTRLTINELLDLREGSLIELPVVSGEPVDVRMNGTRIGGGEVVVVEENFGVRMTQWEGDEGDG